MVTNKDYRVYIPTRNRIPNVLKVVPRWLDAGFDVVLVTDPREKQQHYDVIVENDWYPIRGWQRITGENGVTVIAPEQENAGFGYQCNFAFEHAKSEGVDVYVICDDDLMPKAEPAGAGLVRFDTPQLLVDELRARPSYLGISAVRDYHNFATRGEVAKHFGEVVINASGWQQCYALRVDKLDEIGGYDVELTCHGEGHELIRQSLSVLRRPWLMHCGVYMQPLGKRYDAGGLNQWAIEERDKRGSGWQRVTYESARERFEHECMQRIHKRWPEFVGPPPHGRNSWQKMHDRFVPGWKTFSALHGGGSIDDITDFSFWDEGKPA